MLFERWWVDGIFWWHACNSFNIWGKMKTKWLSRWRLIGNLARTIVYIKFQPWERAEPLPGSNSMDHNLFTADEICVPKAIFNPPEPRITTRTDAWMNIVSMRMVGSFEKRSWSGVALHGIILLLFSATDLRVGLSSKVSIGEIVPQSGDIFGRINLITRSTRSIGGEWENWSWLATPENGKQTG